jgi:hypothetical protein
MAITGIWVCDLQAQTATVYRSVDEQGVVTFSDQPPADSPADVIEIDVAAPEPDPQLEARLEAMRETTDRMAADRREREQHRAELRALAAQDNPPPSEPETLVVERYLPTFVGGWQRPPLRPHPPYQPLPAPYRPGLKSGARDALAGNRQLKRPLLSSRN